MPKNDVVLVIYLFIYNFFHKKNHKIIIIKVEKNLFKKNRIVSVHNFSDVTKAH